MTQKTVPLSSLAKIIRSKNAGPFRITFDVLFESREGFDIVKRSSAISRQSVAAAFGIDESVISSLFAVPSGNAFKVTFRRPVDQGALGETDVYGCQQHVPLMNLPVRVT